MSVDRIVDFDDFEVRRVKMAPKTTWQLEPERDYALVMAVTGELVVGGVVLRPEQAAMIPKGWTGEILNNFSECEMCFLLAYPSLG